MQICAYLAFNGNCRQAMEFYKDCLGGRLALQAVAQGPGAAKMPARMKKAILHATLTKGNLVLMGSDLVGEAGLQKGNAVSLLLDCSSEKEIRACYKKLSRGGLQTHPPQKTFFGALFGNLTDKFGNQWLLHYRAKKRR